MTKPQNKTTIIPSEKVVRQWHLLDANGQILGRLATKIASLLIGKSKTNQSLNHDWGDHVVVINSDKVMVTGNKPKDKIYYRHSGFPGNLKELSLKNLMAKDSTLVIYSAVKNMLPKNKLRGQRLKRLKIFKDGNHPFSDKINNA